MFIYQKHRVITTNISARGMIPMLQLWHNREPQRVIVVQSVKNRVAGK